MNVAMLRYFMFASIIGTLTFCKKKTDVKVRVFNPYIQQYVKDAKVTLIELHRTNFFTSGWGKTYDRKKEIAVAITDADGKVSFSSEKTKLNAKYIYKAVLTEAWGEPLFSDGYGSKEINKLGDNNILLGDYTKGTAKIQFSNLFTPAQSGDSISIVPEWASLPDPVTGSPVISTGFENYHLAYDNTKILPPNYSINTYANQACGKALLRIKKRKMGIVTKDTLTVQFYPKQTTIILVNW